MEKPTDICVERRWYFNVRGNLARGTGFMGVAMTVKSSSGDPRRSDVRKAEERAKAEFARREERALGVMCTGWYPLDDEETTDDD